MCECSQVVEDAVLGIKTEPGDDRERGADEVAVAMAEGEARILPLLSLVRAVMIVIIGMLKVEGREERAGGGVQQARL